MTPLFEAAGLTVRELQPEQVPAVQLLFEANPDYFVAVGGQPPRPDEAQREFDEMPPPPLTFGRRWFAGAFDRQQRLQGVLIVVSDLCAPQVWHTALFFLAGSLRRTGAATRLHAALEDWAMRSGARWLRLGVVAGNTVAERFWARCGYQAVRTREIVDAAGQTRTVRVLVKPLRGDPIARYLQQVPRDEPGSTLP